MGFLKFRMGGEVFFALGPRAIFDLLIQQITRLFWPIQVCFSEKDIKVCLCQQSYAII